LGNAAYPGSQLQSGARIVLGLSGELIAGRIGSGNRFGKDKKASETVRMTY
jgi:hypothetical protein